MKRDIWFIGRDMLKDADLKVGLKDLRFGEKGFNIPRTIDGVKCDTFMCDKGKCLAVRPIVEAKVTQR